MMVVGVGILWTMRDHASVQREVEPKLFRLNFPGLTHRFPALPDRIGRASARSAFAFGTLVGLGAIVGGAIVAF